MIITTINTEAVRENPERLVAKDYYPYTPATIDCPADGGYFETVTLDVTDLFKKIKIADFVSYDEYNGEFEVTSGQIDVPEEFYELAYEMAKEEAYEMAVDKAESEIWGI